MRQYLHFAAILLAGSLAMTGRASAEQVRFRYVPVDAAGNVRQVAIGPEGAIGEKITGVGLIPKPYRETFRPTHMVTFRHPYNNRCVIVPITFPAGAERAPEIRSDHVIYNYGT